MLQQTWSILIEYVLCYKKWIPHCNKETVPISELVWRNDVINPWFSRLLEIQETNSVET